MTKVKKENGNPPKSSKSKPKRPPKSQSVVIHECNFPCCERIFTSRRELLQHADYHSGLNPFMCLVCGMSYKKEGVLMQHMALKHEQQKEEKPRSLRGFSLCNICTVMVPIREKKAHLEKHAPAVCPNDEDEDEEDGGYFAF